MMNMNEFQVKSMMTSKGESVDAEIDLALSKLKEVEKLLKAMKGKEINILSASRQNFQESAGGLMCALSVILADKYYYALNYVLEEAIKERSK